MTLPYIYYSYQLSLGDPHVAEGIKDRNFTTIVPDNIDFGEETLSGKGTTYSTNGIIIERALDGGTDSQVRQHIRPITIIKGNVYQSPISKIGAISLVLHKTKMNLHLLVKISTLRRSPIMLPD